MESYQQIRVRIEPHYTNGLAGSFPRLHRLLSGVDNRLLEQSPPLIDLVDVLVRLAQDGDRDPAAGEVVAGYLDKLKDLREQVTEAVGGWKLSEAQTVLGRMDELFVRLEEELPG
jgi:hypothetical protein